MEVIKDSGKRRKFETGAVRDIQTGKGRTDLLPLDIIYLIYSNLEELKYIEEFKKDGDYNHIIESIKIFTKNSYEEPYTMILELSKHFENGALKYGENNWQKGIPTKHYIDSAIRHYCKFKRGDKDENHDRAFIWNLICTIWTCIKMPELNSFKK